LAQISADRLARGAAIDLAAVREFERTISAPTKEILSRIEGFLEASGIVFISGNGGGVGVRFKFNASETRRIGTLEGEGGSLLWMMSLDPSHGSGSFDRQHATRDAFLLARPTVSRRTFHTPAQQVSKE
jgi:hypothetical protein